MQFKQIEVRVIQHSHRQNDGGWAPVIVASPSGKLALEPSDVSYASWFILEQTVPQGDASILVRQ